MADRHRTRAEARDFPGMVASADPEDVPEGAAEVQVNVNSLVPGELSTRRGYRPVVFESE
jgi:hypothetical protein